MHDSQRMKKQILPKPKTLLQKKKNPTVKRKPDCAHRKFLCCRDTFASEKKKKVFSLNTSILSWLLAAYECLDLDRGSL